MQLAVFKINKAAVAIPGMALGERCHAGTGRQCTGIDLEHMGTRRQSVKAVLAFAIGHHETAVFQIQAYAGNTSFSDVLFAVAVTVQINLAEHISLVAEYAALYLYLYAGDIAGFGQRPGTAGLCAVDTIALRCAGTKTRAVDKGYGGSVSKRTDGK